MVVWVKSAHMCLFIFPYIFIYVYLCIHVRVIRKYRYGEDCPYTSNTLTTMQTLHEKNITYTHRIPYRME